MWPICAYTSHLQNYKFFQFNNLTINNRIRTGECEYCNMFQMHLQKVLHVPNPGSKSTYQA